MKLHFAFFLISITLIADAKDVDRQKTLVVPLSSMPPLSLKYGDEINLNKIFNATTESLVGLDESLYPVPRLAKSWKISSSENAIKFFLSDRKFHDGSNLTARSVLSSFIRAKNNQNSFLASIKGFSSCSLKKCEGLKVVNPKELIIYLNNSNYELFFRKLASVEAAIFKRSGGLIIGTGPYKMISKDKKSITVSRFNSYSYFEKIIFKLVAGRDAINEFKSGQIDLIGDIGFTTPKRELSDYSARTKISGTLYLLFNINSGFFKELNHRKAMQYALDRKTLLTAMDSSSSPAAGMIAKGYLGYQNEPLPKVNIKKAKNLISQATEKIIRIGLTHKYKNKPLEKHLRNIFGSLGLKTKVSYHGFLDLLKIFKQDKVDMIFKGDTPMYYDSSTAFVSFLEGYNGISRLSNKRMNQIFRQYSGFDTNRDRLRALREMDDLFMKHLPALPIAHLRSTTWFQKSLDISDIPETSIKFWEYPFYKLKRTVSSASPKRVVSVDSYGLKNAEEYTNE